MNNKSTIELFKGNGERVWKWKKVNWVRAYNELFKIINGPAYMTGSAF